MAAHWPGATGTIADLMNAAPKVVYSRTLERAEWNNTTLVREDAAKHVAALKREPGGDLYVFGSGELCESLLRADLVDEVRLCVAPVALGTGRPHFGRGLARRRFRLLESRPVSSGAVVLRYATTGAGTSA